MQCDALMMSPTDLKTLSNYGVFIPKSIGTRSVKFRQETRKL